MPTGHLDASGIDFVQLPPVRSDGASFTRLLDGAGNPVTPELMSERTQAILRSASAQFAERADHRAVPVRTPHSARQNSRQRLAAAKAMADGAADLLVDPRYPGAAVEQQEGRADRSLARRNTTTACWSIPTPASCRSKRAGRSRRKPRGCSTIPASSPRRCRRGNPAERDGAGEILVTAGGGPVGRKLFETSIHAARIGGHRWRLLVGGGRCGYGLRQAQRRRERRSGIGRTRARGLSRHAHALRRCGRPMRLQHRDRLAAGRRAGRVRAVRGGGRGRADAARRLAAGTLRLRPDRRGRPDAGESCRLPPMRRSGADASRRTD